MRRLLVHALGEAASLGHEPVDYAVEDRSVVEPLLRVFHEIPNRRRSLVRIQLKGYGSHGCLYRSLHVLASSNAFDILSSVSSRKPPQTNCTPTGRFVPAVKPAGTAEAHTPASEDGIV